MNDFYKGFGKVAALLSKMDAQGGVAPRAPEEMTAAQAVDLLTLPKTVEGASCANCRFLKVLDPKSGMGMCQNPSVMMEVTERMHCNQWDGQGALRNYEVADEAQVQSQGIAAEIGADGMPVEEQQIDPATGQPVEAAAPAEAAPAEKKPAAKKEKKPESKGHEININVGKGAEKKASHYGLDPRMGAAAGAFGGAVHAMIKGDAKKHDKASDRVRHLAADAMHGAALGTIAGLTTKHAEKKAFMDGFNKQASIAGGLGRAMGATKGLATRAGKGIQQIGRKKKLEFRVGQSKGIAESNPALARSIQMKTNPTKSPTPKPTIGSHLRSAAVAGTAIAGGLATGAYLGSKADRDAS